MGKIVKLTPYLSHTVWGGEKLSQIKNIETDSPLGETWEVSTHIKGSSLIGDKPLSDLCCLTYLVKFIDTNKNLSIQVHPDDSYAKEHANDSGKTECWIILDAEENTGIYLGLKAGITKKEFQTALNNKLEMNKFLNFIPVKNGDFFVIPAGTIHAIGSGITLCEVQQSSGVTYRVWDWNRLGLDGKPRELHIEDALNVISFDEKFNKRVSAKKEIPFNTGQTQQLLKHKDFEIQFISIPKNKKIELRLEEKHSLILLSGSVFGDIKLTGLESAIVISSGLFSFSALEDTNLLVVTE